MENYSYLKDVWQINSRDELKSKFDKLTTEQELLNKVDEIADSILQKKLGELKQKTENLANAIKNAVKPQHLEDDRFSNSEWQEVFDALPKDLLEEFDIRNKTDLKDFL
ncbi:MAG: hypothetical protein LBU14_03615 [Candidatus Peribacteria bacterium]|jgi:protein subunit release factor A|nr:hypothetical protein [Candidatus Peribacteria bacterium]